MAKILANTHKQQMAERRRFLVRQKKKEEEYFSTEDKQRIENAKRNIELRLQKTLKCII